MDHDHTTDPQPGNHDRPAAPGPAPVEGGTGGRPGRGTGRSARPGTDDRWIAREPAAGDGAVQDDHPKVARESGGGYDTNPDGDGEVGPSLRAKIAEAGRLLGEALQLAADDTSADTGQLAALLDVLGVVDAANATAVELTARVQHDGLSERAASLPLEHLLSFRTRATYGDRRTLCAAADQLPAMGNLRRAVHAGAVGWGELRAIIAEARHLTAEQRAQLDAGFADLDRLARLEPDRLVDAVGEQAARLRPDLEARRARRRIEHRFLSLSPQLDGAGSGYFELDPASFAPVAAAIQAALPAPSAGPNDITTHAPGETDHDVELDGPRGPGHPDATGPDGQPGFCDPIAFRSRARQRADALVRLAETFLAATPTTDGSTDGGDGSTHDGSTPKGGTGRGGGLRRARPSLQAVCDVRTLAGHDSGARAARALIATVAGGWRLTPAATRRLACDATWQFILVDDGEILGVSKPTTTIPTAVRQAVTARDQGCRFPGCTAPIHWADLHHVIFREHGGPTSVDNLVALCRRHHTAVHEGGWKLTLSPQGAVTVTRGRHTATSDPPHHRRLTPPREPP